MKFICLTCGNGEDFLIKIDSIKGLKDISRFGGDCKTTIFFSVGLTNDVREYFKDILKLMNDTAKDEAPLVIGKFQNDPIANIPIKKKKR